MWFQGLWASHPFKHFSIPFEPIRGGYAVVLYVPHILDCNSTPFTLKTLIQEGLFRDDILSLWETPNTASAAGCQCRLDPIEPSG